MGLVTVPLHNPGDTIPSADWNIIANNINGGGVMIKLADTTLLTTAASVDFTSIPQTFAHLRLITYLRGDTAAATLNTSIRMNNDSTAGHYFDAYGQDTDAAHVSGGDPLTTNTAALLCAIPGASAIAGHFGVASVDIQHYTGVTGSKPYSGTGYYLTNSATGNEASRVIGGIWAISGTAITRLTIFPASGNFIAGSRVTLYGLPQ